MWDVDYEQVGKLLEAEMKERRIAGIAVRDEDRKTLFAARERGADDSVVESTGNLTGNYIHAAREVTREDQVTGSDMLNFRKLLRGRIDAFPIGELVGYDLLKQEFGPFEREMLQVHPREISDAPLHLIAPKGNAEGLALLQRFNEGMAALRASGELQQILEQYR